MAHAAHFGVLSAGLIEEVIRANLEIDPETIPQAPPYSRRLILLILVLLILVLLTLILLLLLHGKLKALQRDTLPE